MSRNLAEFVAEKRKECGYSVKKLAELTGVNTAYISDMESGYLKTMPKSGLDKLSQALALTTAERHELFDLASNGRIPEDIMAYVAGSRDVQAFLRTAMDGYPSKKELCRRFMKNLTVIPPNKADVILGHMAAKKKRNGTE